MITSLKFENMRIQQVRCYCAVPYYSLFFQGKLLYFFPLIVYQRLLMRAYSNYFKNNIGIASANQVWMALPLLHFMKPNDLPYCYCLMPLPNDLVTFALYLQLSRWKFWNINWSYWRHKWSRQVRGWTSTFSQWPPHSSWETVYWTEGQNWYAQAGKECK